MSLTEQIQTIISSMTDNNYPPQIITIRKAYDNHTADITTNDGVLKNIRCSGLATDNSKALLIYENGDLQKPFVLLFTAGEVDIVNEWETILSAGKVPSEKLVKETLDTELSGKSDTGHTHTLSDITDYSTGGLVQKKKNVWSSSINLTYTLYVDEVNRHCVLTITGSNISIPSGTTNYEVDNFVPSDYRPKATQFCRLMRSNSFLAYMWANGTVGISNFNSSTSTGQTMSGQMDWSY